MSYPLINFAGIHLVPNLIAYACTFPTVCAFLNDTNRNIGSIALFRLSITATVLRGASDIRMRCFRKRKINGFIRTELWKYSRDLNYPGEILMWWSASLSVVSAFPKAWYLYIGARANALLFPVVSIPMADKRQSVKLGLDEYKKQTRMPLPIKK